MDVNDLRSSWQQRIYIEPNTGCWLWLGTIFQNGYGHVFVKTENGWRHRKAHRVVYEQLVGPVPDGLELDHLCRTRSCCNPAHLEPVTNYVNRFVRGRAGLFNAEKTHCKNGHPFTPENTYLWGQARYCRQCRAAAVMRVYQRRKAQNG
jgi:hypothetical protein